MFNTLASYLLGQSTVTNQNIENPEELSSIEKENSVNPTKNLKIKTTICDENEWLIVDRDDSDEEGSLPRTDSEDELPTVEIKKCPLIYKSKRNGPSSVSPNFMEESSWFVTPPPCFTSTSGPLLETSPLENLLIEHPRYKSKTSFKKKKTKCSKHE
jgi:hypothetical protein